MEIKVDRKYKKAKYTIGKMYIDGEYLCDTLEDTVRDLSHEKKVAGLTAIPAGRYLVTLTYSPKFGRELPLLHDVPYFTGIRIHRGNVPEDSSGCILVGENKAKGMVLNSTPYEKALVKKIKEAKEDIYIEIS